MSKIALNVNGKMHALDVDLATPLLYILSNDLGFKGPRFGCGLGQCGATQFRPVFISCKTREPFPLSLLP